MDFVWDARKAAANRKKHGVSIEEACTALRDSLAATGTDPDHSKAKPGGSPSACLIQVASS